MKSRLVYIFYFLVTLTLPWMQLNAQQVQVSARIDSSSILIGNQAHIHLTAAYDVKNGVPKIQWPLIGDSLVSKVEVISKSKIDTVIVDKANPNVQQQVQDITISSFDSGYYAIPPFRFVVNGDTANPQLTEAIMLQVNTVHIDTTKAFKDIKAPIQVNFNILEILPYVGLGLLGLILVAGLIWLIVWSSRKRAPLQVVEKPEVILPPHVLALQELEKLALKKLWQEGRIKEYYTGITDILRNYIYGRYGIGAPEMTTDEIIVALKRKDISETMKQKLREILVLSDLVKFAKENPMPNDHEFCFSASVDFIKETAEREVKQEVAAPAGPNQVEQNTVTE
jgi:hypothetical protein